MKIVLFTSVFYNNIGNGFIDLGAEATVKEAMTKGDELIKLSQCANFAATMDWKFRIREVPGVRFLWNNLMRHYAKKLHDKAYNAVTTHSVISVPQLVKCDVFIIPGCVLTVPFFKIYGSLLEEKKRQGAKIVFLGASGNHYSDYEISYVRDWLHKLQPEALMFRDSVAYNAYRNLSNKVYNGIDNVFFVNRVEIPKIETTVDPYFVLNFDLKENQGIKKNLELNLLQGKNIIYTDHKPYPQSHVTKQVKNGVIISDYPLDYLTIYKNVDTTFSDRVHACIPTLSFGNKAQLFSRSPRKALFENVGLNDISSKPTKIDGLDEIQDRQIRFLRALLQNL